ncbi:MAG: PTS system mannose/fructose/N-acetylgalactosamine-transporter subunit IIB [Anaerolineae bacterium]
MVRAMMPEGCAGRRFGLVRVDERLLHGQVALNWVRTLGTRRIVVLDDVLAADPTACGAMALAVPEGVELAVASLAEAGSLLANSGVPDAHTLILLRNPAAVLALYRAGCVFGRLNLGFMGSAAGRVRVHPQVHLAPHDLEALQSLASLGVSVTVQAVPSEAPLSWDALLRRARRRLR